MDPLGGHNGRFASDKANEVKFLFKCIEGDNEEEFSGVLPPYSCGDITTFHFRMLNEGFIEIFVSHELTWATLTMAHCDFGKLRFL